MQYRAAAGHGAKAVAGPAPTSKSYRDDGQGRGGDNRPFEPRFGIVGELLEKIEWNGEQLVPVRKDFAFLHPNVEAKPEEDCELIRLRLGIHVLNVEAEVPKPVECLEEAPFPDWAMSVLRQRGFERPTPIQVQGWPAVLHGHDTVGVASTGSGKTMAYVMPMLVHVMAQPELLPGEGPVGLVLVPHRELCQQVHREIEAFEAFTGLVCRVVCGGADEAKQKEEALHRVDVVVATPGRLIRMLNKRWTNLRRATYVVLDEADELLSHGFEDQVRLIMSQIRPDRQVLLFSATWEEAVEKLAHDVCDCKPIQINCGNTKLSACKEIDQTFWCVGRVGANWPVEESKVQALCRAVRNLLQNLREGAKALVFCNTKDVVPKVVEFLKAAGLPGEEFSSKLSQHKRDKLLEDFRQHGPSEQPVLVCTQVLGRGHDFQNVRYVINYDMPGRLVDYVHRIGRTGRAGQRGFSLTLLEEVDLRLAKELVQCLEHTAAQGPPPWLKTESSKKRQVKYSRQFRDEGPPAFGCALPAPEPVPTKEPGSSVQASWDGRGRGRRGEFLKQCCGCGAARA